MSFKDILKVFKLERELTDDETALLNTLRGMSESEWELLTETLGPTVKAKAKPTATKRVIEKCGACNYTRRAAHHKEGHKDYHEFQSSKKSARASSIAGAIGRSATGLPRGVSVFCTYEVEGKVCHGSENDGIHDKSLGYGNYHPFVSSSPARNAVGQLSTNDDEVNSETGSGAVSSAAGD